MALQLRNGQLTLRQMFEKAVLQAAFARSSMLLAGCCGGGLMLCCTQDVVLGLTAEV
jgi:hypothetical protein